MRKAYLLIALPLALAACGGGGAKHAARTAGRAPKIDPVSYVRRAAHKTAAAPSEHMTMTGKVGASGVDVSLRGAGDFSNTQHAGTLRATFAAAGMNGKIDEVMDGTTVYMSSPLFASSLPAGKKWVKVDLQKLGKSQGLDFSSLMSRSPTQAFRQLEAAATVEQLGAETIDGVATTHYRVEHLDVSKLPQGSKLEALAHPKYGPIDIWIGNGNGYIYRETLSVGYTASGQTATMRMSTSFSRFGEAVHATPPPASETVDGSNLATGGLGG
jgi:hypothetical protein